MADSMSEKKRVVPEVAPELVARDLKPGEIVTGLPKVIRTGMVVDPADYGDRIPPGVDAVWISGPGDDVTPLEPNSVIRGYVYWPSGERVGP